MKQKVSGERNRAREIVKAVLFTSCYIISLPLIALTWVEKRLSRSEGLFLLFGQFLAMIPGFPGRLLRGAYYFGALDRCSWETHIGFGTLFTHRSVAIGRRVSMGAYCVIGHVQIGNDVMIGSRVSIPSGKRQHLDERGRLVNVTRFDQVAVGSFCWIGEGAIVMAEVGERSVVSAGAVVIRDVPAGSLVGGNPAKVIREITGAAADEWA